MGYAAGTKPRPETMYRCYVYKNLSAFAQYALVSSLIYAIYEQDTIVNGILSSHIYYYRTAIAFRGPSLEDPQQKIF